MVGSANTHIGFFANSGSTHWLGWVWGARLRRDGYPDQWRGTPTDLRHKLVGPGAFFTTYAWSQMDPGTLLSLGQVPLCYNCSVSGRYWGRRSLLKNC